MINNNDFLYKNILITGGAGFIGSNYINNLLLNYSNLNIINIDRLDYCSDLSNILYNDNNTYNNKYFFYQYDICDFNNILNVLIKHNIELIVHFAAQSHVDNSFCNSVQFTKDNILGTNYLLEACRCYGLIKKFIHFSTDEVYGEIKNTDDGCNEEYLLNPTNPYAASKAGAEFIVKSYYYSWKLPIIITRCNNAYGPNQYPEKLIPKFIKLLLNNQQCTIHGNGSNSRTFIHTDDISKAVDIIIQKGKINEIYNIGSKNEYSIMDIFNILVKYLKPNDDPNFWFKYVEDRNFNDNRYFVKIDKLNYLGWYESIDFNNGIISVIEYYKNKFNNNK